MCDVILGFAEEGEEFHGKAHVFGHEHFMKPILEHVIKLCMQHLIQRSEVHPFIPFMFGASPKGLGLFGHLAAWVRA